MAHALLALSLSAQKQYAEATDEARRAVHLAPEFPFAHYTLASVLDDQDRFPEAEAAVNEAIRLDPDDADHFALLGSIRLQQRQWEGALSAAEAALAVEPEHVNAANLRAIALQKLGRRQEAGATLGSTLARDPENAVTHANQGWALLENGDHTRAMEHFREALRLEPGLDWAREGVLEALKARNPVYRVLLAYFFWMARLSDQVRWGIIIGGSFLFRALRATAKANPDAAPFLYPLMGLYVAFVFLTWTAEPLFNLLLRLNPLGRMALSREQIAATNWIGGCLLGALTFGALFAASRAPWAAIGGIGCALMMIPISSTFGATGARGRKILAVVTTVLGALALGAVALTAAQGMEGPGLLLLGLFLIGVFAFSWVANAISHRR